MSSSEDWYLTKADGSKINHYDAVNGSAQFDIIEVRQDFHCVHSCKLEMLLTQGGETKTIGEKTFGANTTAFKYILYSNKIENPITVPYHNLFYSLTVRLLDLTNNNAVKGSYDIRRLDHP